MNARVRVDLLRHGACEGGAIYRGRTDSPLTEAGRRQMMQQQALGRWERVYSSPLQRCRSVAGDIARERGVALVVDEALREMDFGDWDGESLDAIWERERARVLAFWRDPVGAPPPGAEPLPALQRRCLALLDRLAEAGESSVLLVTHGGVIRAILCHLLRMPLSALQQLSVDYASLTRIELYPRDSGGWDSQLIFSNRLAGLDDYA